MIKGEVYNYPGHEDAAPISTSQVARAQGYVFFTHSGSRYQLADPIPWFKREMEMRGHWDEDNPLETILALSRDTREGLRAIDQDSEDEEDSEDSDWDENMEGDEELDIKNDDGEDLEEVVIPSALTNTIDAVRRKSNAPSSTPPRPPASCSRQAFPPFSFEASFESLRPLCNSRSLREICASWWHGGVRE